MITKPMTREEYVKKYGSEPFSSSTIKVSELQEPKKNIAEKVGGFLGIDKFAKGIGQAAFALTPEKKALDKLADQGLISGEDYTDVTTGGLSNRDVIGSAVNTAALFAPGASKGASLAKKVATGAATGYAMDVGSKLQNPENTTGGSFKPGAGTVVGAALPVLGRVFGNISPKRLEEINLRMTPREKELMAKQGKDIPEFLAKKKIVGTPEVRYQKVDKLYDAMEDRVAKMIKDSGAKFSKNDVLKVVREIPQQFTDDPAGYDEATRVSNKLLEFFQGKSQVEIEGDLLNKYKRNLFKRAYSKNNTDVVNESYHAVASALNDMLREKVPGLQKVNEEYGKLVLSRKILSKATSRSQLGITGKILGAGAGAGVGGAVGGPIGAGAGAVIGEKVAEKALGTATRSAVGATIQSVAEKIPEDKMGNLQISKKALIRLLQGVFGQ